MSSTPTTPSSTAINASFHRTLLSLWFGSVSPAATSPPFNLMQIWFGIGLSPAQSAAFDQRCKAVASNALAAFSPTAFPLPPYTTPEADRILIGGPLAKLVHRDASPNAAAYTGTEGDASTSTSPLSEADVARSLAILLDQMPRNIFRSVAEQKLVFAHYDRIARVLAHATLSADVAASSSSGTPSPLAGLDAQPHPTALQRRMWFYMPLMHSESLADHDAFSRGLESMRAASDPADEGAQKYIANVQDFEEKHRVIIERFGRYPHRNAALGRTPTDAEKAFLEGGGDTFGSGGQH